MGSIDNQLKELSAEKRALFELLLRQRREVGANPAQQIPRRERSDYLPLSVSQQRLWFLNQLNPADTSYNIYGSIHFKGALNVHALERTFQEIVRRHEALRTTFVSEAGQPFQVIQPATNITLPVVDLQPLPEAAREVEVTRLVDLEIRRPFDLTQGPLLRVNLLRLAEQEHVLILNMHHVVSDGWSLGILIREVATLYEAFSQGRPSPLPDLPIQYADYAVWQRQWLTGEVLENQLSYWREQLSGAPAVLELPTDRPRPAVQSFRGAAHSIQLSAELTEKLRQLSRAEDVTLFMTLLSALSVLLSRLSGQDDIVVGTPIANRTRVETESLIGFFVNTLVLRTKVEAGESFRSVLAKVREVTLGAYSHQEVPFEKLVEELRPERDLSHSPLFQVMFVLQNAPRETLRLGGVELRAGGASNETANFDLALELTEDAEGVTGVWQYSTELFEAETIERWGGHFQTLLEAITSEPERRVAELPLLTAGEREQLLVEWNQTAREYPRERRVHELFEEQVERTPEAVAVTYEDRQVTYGELNRRANQLAHYLRQHGVGPEVLVGLCAERSVEMVVGLLGVLKAGGAYVPLDPEYPQERLAFMLEDSGLDVVVTQQHILARLSPHKNKIICLDTDWKDIGSYPCENPTRQARETDVAYTIYTSGSVGKPKAVLVEQRNLANIILASQDKFQFRAGDVMPCLSPFSFDISLFELMNPLVAGGTSIILPREKILDTGELVELLTRVNLIHTVPSLMREIVNLIKGTEVRHIRSIFIGGDLVPTDLLEEMTAVFPDSQIHILYGPTEGTIICTSYSVQKGQPVRGTIIGRPLNNITIRLYDEHRNSVPIGVPGELYLGGAGVTRGYLNREELTREKYVLLDGQRYYRTGDLAKYLPDGNIEFLGRIDQQVKLRGYRIELGEIETLLSQHPEIEQAVVLLRGEGAEQRLVAYLVGGRELQHGELRAYLKERLPEYMVPSVFVQLAELPLTPNGKIDRRALPEPEQGRLEAGREYVAPQTQVEELLVGIWEEVLGVERVGVHDNFFESGGHSLLATQLISRVRAAFGIELPLRRLFESPSVRELAAAVEAALRQDQTTSVPAIGRAPRGQESPLSYAQQRLWFLDQLEPQTAFYNVPAAVRLTGDLNLPALTQTFNEIVRRHEALRTTFATSAGSPVQLISTVSDVELPLVDLSYLAADERETEARRLATAEAQQPFDLSTGPLFRVQVLRLSITEHILLCTMHHVVSDGWSMGVLVREVAALYEAYSQGRPSPLPELPIQYADYALWQREWLTGEVLESQLSYWREQLSGAPAVLELPTDRPRPAVQSFRGAAHRIELPAELTESLRKLSRAEGVTLFMTLLSAFSVLLSRLSGQDDIVIGTPIANRTRVETEGLIGFFVNTLVLRTRVEAQKSFRALLARVREITLGAYGHQEVPFEKLVEELQPERDLSHSPLFQVMVVQNTAMGELKMTGSSLAPVEVETEAAKFDLTLELTESGQGLSGVWQYSTELFEAETIERWAGHFQTLLEAIVSEPERDVAGLEILSGAEREQLLTEWNQTAREYPRQRCVHELFEEQAERTPEAVAVVYREEELTYGELNRRANQLAHYLRGMGVGPESLVGLCVERSVEMVVGLLGILKAGGAYVPLDPEYPQERLAFMLEDAQVRVLLAQKSVRGRLPEHCAKVIGLDDDWSFVADQSTRNPDAGVRATNLAYVLYTSGSTGKPKGVMIPHGGVVNYLYWCINFYQIMDGYGAPVHSPLGFDLTVTSLFGPLLAGRVALLAAEAQGIDELHGALHERTGFSLVKLTPAHLEMLSEVMAAETVAGRAAVLVIGGEALRSEPLKFWRRHAPETRLINEYGPTETVVGCAIYEVEPRQSLQGNVPVGRPIANTRLYILDERQEPTPVGVVGELYIGGAGLARGYLDRPDLTAERFVPHPFSAEPGARLYRTGDLAKYLPDGNIEFLGRIDQQVKLRGYRIELGEIETVLGQHPAVREAVVTLSGQGSEQRLVAYLVAERELRQGELRAYLKERLPEYMAPAAFVQLEELPLTPNGKIDRRALPAPQQGRLEAGQQYAAPQTLVEELLVGLWEEVLGVERVGVGDDFFELGGHSLLATQLISRVRGAFGVEMPLRRLFESPTVRSLAGAVEAALKQETSVSVPAIERVARGQGLPLSYAQQRLWFIDQLEPQSALYNVPAAVRLTGELNLPALERAFDEIVRRHEALRTTFVSVEGEPLQVISDAADVELPLVDLSHLATKDQETEVRRLAAAEAQLPFDLSRGPLFRVQALRLSITEHILLCTMHHVVSDGWSIWVLVREVAALYEAYSQGQPSPLPELSIQYADYAVWQREWLTGEVLEAQLAYWREQLQGAPAVLELPTDRPRPAVQSFRGAAHRIELPEELTEALRKLSRAEGVTLFMTLLSAFSVLLSRLSGQDDVVVGTPIANRTRVETESLIGFFVNTLVLRTKVEAGESFRALLSRVREVTLGAYGHQEVPFEKLVEELQPDRDLSHSPLFQVMVVQNAAMGELKMTGVSLSELELEIVASKFDLTLWLTDGAAELRLALQYNTDLFNAATIERMAEQLRTLLSAVVADPDAGIASLSLISEEERAQLSDAFNDDLELNWA